MRAQVQLNPDISESTRPSCPSSPQKVKPSSGTYTPQTYLTNCPPKSSTRPGESSTPGAAQQPSTKVLTDRTPPQLPPGSKPENSGTRASAAGDAQLATNQPGCHRRAAARTVGATWSRSGLRAYSPSLAGSESGPALDAAPARAPAPAALRCALRSNLTASCPGGARGWGAQARGWGPLQTNAEARGLRAPKKQPIRRVGWTPPPPRTS